MTKFLKLKVEINMKNDMANMESKKYLILPASDDGNRGDQALVWVTRDIAEEAGFIGKYYMISEPEKNRQSFQNGIVSISPILSHPSSFFKKNGENIHYGIGLKFKWGAASFYNLTQCFPLLKQSGQKIQIRHLTQEQKQTLKVFREADAVFVKGGGFIHSYGGIIDAYRVFYSLFHIMLALEMGLKVYVMPNSYGPFEGPFVKKIVHNVLSKCELVYARETISKKALKRDCNVQSFLNDDLAFYMKSDPNFDAIGFLKKRGIPLDKKKCVAITMRPNRFAGSTNPKILYENYKKALYRLVEWLSGNDYYPVIVEHVLSEQSHEKDIQCIYEVANLLKEDCDYAIFSEPELDCRQMRMIYSCFDYVIGTRFHSVVFAMSEGVPAIAITYGGNKGEGIMRDLGLGDYAVPMDNMTENTLICLFKKLVANEQEVREKIRCNNERIRNRRTGLVDRLKKERELG